jgi:hypothetical protein
MARTPELAPHQKEAHQATLISTELRILLIKTMKDGENPYSILPDYLWHNTAFTTRRGYRNWVEREGLDADDLPSAPRAEATRVFHLEVKAADTIFDSGNTRENRKRMNKVLKTENTNANQLAAQLGIKRTPLQRVNRALIPVLF